jgi:hypothetical protein
MSKLLQTLYQVGEDLHGVVYQDPFKVCLPLLRHHLLCSLLSGPRLVPKIVVGVATRQEKERKGRLLVQQHLLDDAAAPLSNFADHLYLVLLLSLHPGLPKQEETTERGGDAI